MDNKLFNIPVNVLDCDGIVHKGILQLDFDLEHQKVTLSSKVQPSQKHSFPDARVTYDMNLRIGKRQERSINPEQYMYHLKGFAASMVGDFVASTYAQSTERITDRMQISDNERNIAIANIVDVIDRVAGCKPHVKFHHIDKYGDDYVGILNINGVDMAVSVVDRKLTFDNEDKVSSNYVYRIAKNHADDVVNGIRKDIKEYEDNKNKVRPRTFEECLR